MEKKIFIKRASVFIILTLSILLTIQFFIDSKMESIKTGYVGKINRVIQNDVDEDLTIWGASTAEGNVIPKVLQDSLGLSVFNMGLDGTNIHQYGGLLEKYLQQVNNKIIILAFDINGGLMRRKSPYHLYNWLHTFNQELITETYYDIDYIQTLKIKYIPFYKLIIYGKHNLKYFKASVDSFTFKQGGFTPRNGVINPSGKEREITFPNDSTIVKNIRRICKLANINNNKIFILLTPCFNYGLKQGINTELILNNFKSLQNDKTHFLNFVNHPMNLEKKYFKDNTHLNNTGAIFFSKLITDTLKKYFLSDHYE